MSTLKPDFGSFMTNVSCPTFQNWEDAEGRKKLSKLNAKVSVYIVFFYAIPCKQGSHHLYLNFRP